MGLLCLRRAICGHGNATGWSAGSWPYVYCIQCISIHELWIVVFLVLFHVIFGIHVSAYILTVFTDPGSPPDILPSDEQHLMVPLTSLPPLQPITVTVEPRDQPLPATSSNSTRHIGSSGETSRLLRDQISMVMAKRNGQPRFCRKCSKPKPDRTHHCSMCGRCIIRLDHHCPWVNNCVGFRNQKFFMLFILYGAFLGGYVALSVLPIYSQRVQTYVCSRIHFNINVMGNRPCS